MGSRAGVEREVIINREAERRPDRAAMMSNVSARPLRLFVASAAVRRAVTDPQVRPIIDWVTGAGKCAPLAGSSVTGLVSDGAGREEM
jgi:hypothetical protein